MDNMSENRKISVFYDAPEPPSYLASRILRSIEREERKKIYRQIMVSAALLTVSLGSAVASVMSLGAELVHSGFFSFASLFASDFSFAITNLHELSLSLVESFPAISGAFFLASIGLAIWCSMRLMTEAGIVRQNKFFATS